VSGFERDQPCFVRIGVYGDRSCGELATHVHCLRCPVFAETAHELFERPPPPGYRDEWTERLATVEATTASASSTYVTVRVGSEWLGIVSRDCVEVTEARRAFPLAHRMGGAFEGLVNVRGQAMLCVSLRLLLDISSEEGPGARARLVVVETPEGRFALRVDEVDRVRRIPDADVQPAPMTLSHALSPHVRGIVHDENRLIGVLDSHALFATLTRCVA
jgi:chemotaxis-related protein WspD